MKIKSDAMRRREKLAGAEGFEPSPSTLTVWCPTGWTTPQRRSPAPTASGFPESGWAPLQNGAAEGSSKIPCPCISQAPLPQEFICPFRAVVHLEIRKESSQRATGGTQRSDGQFDPPDGKIPFPRRQTKKCKAA